MFYDYECAECGHTEERMVSLKTRDAQFCIECGGLMRRLPHYGQTQINVPSTFHVNARDFREPRLPGERESWDEAAGLPSRRVY